MALHAPDMVFDNHTAGERAEGEAVREHIGSIFETWPDIVFATRRLYVRDGLVVQEWTATATHANRMRRGDLVAEPSQPWDLAPSSPPPSPLPTSPPPFSAPPFPPPPPSGKTVSWDGLDVIPFENGQVKRKDVYSDSVSILRQVGCWSSSSPASTAVRCSRARRGRIPAN